MQLFQDNFSAVAPAHDVAGLFASMYSCIAMPLTWRLTLDFCVIQHGQVANVVALVTAVENILADQIAASSWCKFLCIFRVFKIKSLIRVRLTPMGSDLYDIHLFFPNICYFIFHFLKILPDGNCRANGILLFKRLFHSYPQRIFSSQNVHVSNNEEPIFGSRESNADPVLSC